MTEFFLNIVNMSISAGWIVLAVLILRLLLKKAPKWITVLLWGIVAFRLICPFSIESALSLIPSTQTINPEYALNSVEIDSGIPIIDNTINPIISGAMVTVQPEKDINFFHIIMPYLAGLWLVGIFALLLYTVISYVRLKKKIGTAVLYKDNIFQSESVISPFVLGIIKPKIYLPFNMTDSDMENVVAHEQAHIKRKDHWWKPLGFLLLTIHWFNPLMWVGYIMLCKDIELACDEKVVKNLDTEQRADYSQALLSCSVNRRMIAACPLAFGEVGVKSRIKTVLNYKKPAFWIIVVGIIASVVVAVCFLTNPINTSDKVLNKLINLEDYEVVEQDEKRITLSIPVSELSDKIYTDSGKTFSVNQVIAYQDATTSIYLKEARYSNEGKNNLYFCFDFAFNLPKKQGTLLYPYEITNSGLSGSVRTADGILKADNGEFADAIADRGQGDNKLIWFYVSTDALKQAQGTIRFDVSLNEITYFLDGDDYNSASKHNINGTINTFNQNLPKLYVAYGNSKVRAWTGTASWSFATGNGTAQTINADSSHPLAMAEYLKPWAINIADRDEVPPVLTLNFDVVPDSIKVNAWFFGKNGNTKSFDANVDGFNINLPDMSETCLYEVVAEWNSADEHSGTIHYAFCVTSYLIEDMSIKEIVDRTVTEGIATDDAEQPFYVDENFVYSFSSIKSEYIIVKFNNGEEMTVQHAIEQGLITITDLDKWDIEYNKKEYNGEIELSGNGNIVGVTSYPILDDATATVSNAEKSGPITAVFKENTLLYTDNYLHSSMFIIPEGKAVNVLETDSDQGSAKISYAGYTGWVKSSTLDIA